MLDLEFHLHPFGHKSVAPKFPRQLQQPWPYSGGIRQEKNPTNGNLEEIQEKYPLQNGYFGPKTRKSFSPWMVILVYFQDGDFGVGIFKPCKQWEGVSLLPTTICPTRFSRYRHAVDWRLLSRQEVFFAASHLRQLDLLKFKWFFFTDGTPW